MVPSAAYRPPHGARAHYRSVRRREADVDAELRARAHIAYEADGGFSEPRADGEWGWKVEQVAALFWPHTSDEPLFFVGCSEEQALLSFDHKVLLTGSRSVMAERLRPRTGNDYGNTDAELGAALAYADTVEPLLRASANTIIETTRPPAEVADHVPAALSNDGGQRQLPKLGNDT